MEFYFINKLLKANCIAFSLQEYYKKVKDNIGLQFFENRLLKHQKRLIIIEEQNLWTQLIAKIYTQVSTAYFRKNKTRKIISDRYYWPRMVMDINCYIRNCNSCYKSIIPQDKTPGLLKPLLIPERPQQYVFIDFYKLPTDRDRYNIVIILINRFSKRPFSIPYYKNIDAKEAAQLYIYYVY